MPVCLMTTFMLRQQLWAKANTSLHVQGWSQLNKSHQTWPGCALSIPTAHKPVHTHTPPFKHTHRTSSMDALLTGRHTKADLHQGLGRTLVLSPPDSTAVPCKTSHVKHGAHWSSLELGDQVRTSQPVHISASELARLEQRGALGTPSFQRPSKDNSFPSGNCPPTQSRGPEEVKGACAHGLGRRQAAR